LKIFITGATGLVGRHLVDRLLLQGHEVITLIRAVAPFTMAAAEKLKIIRGDVMDLNGLAGAIGRVDVIIHCAAITTFSHEFQLYGRQALAANIEGTHNVANLALQLGASQMLHLSSSSVMGDNYEGERDESAPCNPDNDYGRSKFEAEKEVLKAGSAGLPVTIFRPGLIYGAFDRGGMRAIIDRVYKNRWITLGSGENKKNLTCVHNLVDALMLAMGNPAAFGQIFFINDGIPYSINELINTIQHLLDRKESCLHVPVVVCLALSKMIHTLSLRKKGKLNILAWLITQAMRSTTYRIDKAKKILNFQPKRMLEYGLGEEIEWLINEKKGTLER